MCFAIASEFQNSEQKGGLQIKKSGVVWRLHKCRGRLQKKKSGVIRRLHNFPLSWFFRCLTMPRRSIVRRSLRPSEAKAHIHDDPAPGHLNIPIRDCWSVLRYMVRPIQVLQRLKLLRVGRPDLIPRLDNYLCFRLGLGMLRPRRVDDIWDRNGALCANAHMAKLLTRAEYYTLHKYVSGCRLKKAVSQSGCTRFFRAVAKKKSGVIWRLHNFLTVFVFLAGC